MVHSYGRSLKVCTPISKVVHTKLLKDENIRRKLASQKTTQMLKPFLATTEMQKTTRLKNYHQPKKLGHFIANKKYFSTFQSVH